MRRQIVPNGSTRSMSRENTCSSEWQYMKHEVVENVMNGSTRNTRSQNSSGWQDKKNEEVEQFRMVVQETENLSNLYSCQINSALHNNDVSKAVERIHVSKTGAILKLPKSQTLYTVREKTNGTNI